MLYHPGLEATELRGQNHSFYEESESTKTPNPSADQSWHWELLMDMLLGGLALLSESYAYLRGESLLCYLVSPLDTQSLGCQIQRVLPPNRTCAT